MTKAAFVLITAAYCCPMVAQDTQAHPDSEAGSCDVCDVLHAPIKISCGSKRTQTDKDKVTLSKGMTISWTGPSADADWKVVFRRSPCEDKRTVFDPRHSSCTVGDVTPTSYVYKIKLPGCHHSGKGRVKVVRTPVK